jgi:hypothetical protein
MGRQNMGDGMAWKQSCIFTLALSFSCEAGICDETGTLQQGAAPVVGQVGAHHPENWQPRLTAHCGDRLKVELAMVLSLPELHDQVLNNTFLAFRRGGWPASIATLRHIVAAALQSYASDDSIMATEQAFQAVKAALRLTPELCQKALFTVVSPEAFPQAASEVRAWLDAKSAMSRSGLDARQHGQSPPLMHKSEADDVLRYARDAPEQLTLGERDAIDHKRSNTASAADVCEASLKLVANLIALGKTNLGRLRRFQARNESQIDSTLELNPPSISIAPPDFICPSVGTRFTLSDYDLHGNPVQQTILGRRNWDCHILSSVTGDRDFRYFNDQVELPGYFLPDWLPQMWPLSVGKKIHQSYYPALGDRLDEDVEITGHGPQPFGKERALAYEVTQDIIVDGGKGHYRLIDYWAPSIGYQIAHRTIVFRGKAPPQDSPDWRIIGIRGPGPEKKL